MRKRKVKAPRLRYAEQCMICNRKTREDGCALSHGISACACVWICAECAEDETTLAKLRSLGEEKADGRIINNCFWLQIGIDGVPIKVPLLNIPSSDPDEAREYARGLDVRPECVQCTIGRYEGFIKKVRRGMRPIKEVKPF